MVGAKELLYILVFSFRLELLRHDVFFLHEQKLLTGQGRADHQVCQFLNPDGKDIHGNVLGPFYHIIRNFWKVSNLKKKILMLSKF